MLNKKKTVSDYLARNRSLLTSYYKAILSNLLAMIELFSLETRKEIRPGYGVGIWQEGEMVYIFNPIYLSTYTLYVCLYGKREMEVK